MDKLLDSTASKPAKKPRTVTVTRNNLERTNLIFPVKEHINSFTINTNEKLPVGKSVCFCKPTHHKNFISHCTFHWFHMKTLEIFNYISPFSRQCWSTFFKLSSDEIGIKPNISFLCFCNFCDFFKKLQQKLFALQNIDSGNLKAKNFDFNVGMNLIQLVSVCYVSAENLGACLIVYS